VGAGLAQAEDLLVGAPRPADLSSAKAEPESDKIARARTVFEEMQRQYASDNFTRYGALLQQLEKLHARSRPLLSC
jgi:hypothetical protein